MPPKYAGFANFLPAGNVSVKIVLETDTFSVLMFVQCISDLFIQRGDMSGAGFLGVAVLPGAGPRSGVGPVSSDITLRETLPEDRWFPDSGVRGGDIRPERR
ncbi:hypothetical protein [Tropicimonas sp.]|uniref:hypothetical protein n=1 Tax=Tropicimonas sp. TaxID=2067044 RepID=UPI003A8929EE